MNDPDSFDCASAERSFARCIGAGCSIPAGAYAEVDGDILTLRGLYIDDTGNFRRGLISGRRGEADILGVKLAGVILG